MAATEIKTVVCSILGVFLTLVKGAVLNEIPSNLENENMEHDQLQRHKRDLTWDDVEVFYEDKNNFAMYLVLPIIVIVYGGCAVIYCIARCRRYVRKKKRKPKQHSETTENEPLDDIEAGQQRHASFPIISTNANPRSGDGSASRDGARTSSDVQIGVDRNNGQETPLPWQVPGEKQQLVAGAAAASKKGYENKSYEADFNSPKQPNSQRPPPSYEETYHKRPISKPPPYEENGNRERRGSVEEIITLDPVPRNDSNDRKRRRPGSRNSTQHSQDNGARDKYDQQYEDERQKARQVVRGDRPRRDIQSDKNNRERTPDIISHARTKPLEPRYRPTHNDPQSDATLMAKQAAQLLRLDHMGKQQGKKQKRLVFVAE